DELRERLTKYCKAVITEEEYIPVVAIDAELPVDDIDVDIIDRVSDLEPYGMANSTPVFAIMEATVQDIMLMGQLKNHCKIIFETSNGTLDAIAWNRPDLFKSIFVGTVVKVAFSLQKNEWQGMVSPQLMIQAIEPLTEEPIKLSTEGLRQMYVIIKQSMRGRSQSVYNVEQDILRRKPADQNNRSALTSIDVFKELGIVEEYTSDDGQLMLRWNAIEGKLDLVTSVTFLTYSV
ncbi:MAG: single-stranded-DNA-specific exonuclease RecJ, partial [Veillonella parvula]